MATAKEIRAEIKNLRREMREQGIRESSMMNRHPSLEAMRANERLFALKVALECADKDAKGTTTQAVKLFLAERDVDILAIGPTTTQAAAEMFNEKHKTRLTADEFKQLAIA